jgi:signal transduction histidine kinase
VTDSIRPTEAATAVERAVQAARLDMVFGSQPMALAVSVVLATLTVFILAGDVGAARLCIWLAALVLVSAARGWLTHRYRLERGGGLSDLDRWEKRFELGCLFAGSTWGSTALLIFPNAFALQGFLAFVLAGVSSGAMAELSVTPRLARAFIIPCVTPLAARFFFEGDALHLAMGTMTLLYVGLITFAMRRGHAQLRQTVAAQLDASASRRALTETAQRVDVLKSEFVSVVSHELRTPLTALRGSLGLLAHQGGEGLSERGRQLVAVASRNAERLHALIEDLLDMEKIETGVLRFTLKEQPLLPLVEQAMASACAFAMTHAVDLRLARDPARVSAAVDASRFLQLMTNLLSNAAKFSPPDSTVEVVILRHEEWARIEIRDRGPGIPATVRPRIFSKFCQGDSSDSRRQGGTGLGLAISKAIVEQMGGTIGFDSRAGHGTTFFFELPVCDTFTP